MYAMGHRFAEFAVVGHVDAELLLAAHDIADGVVQKALESRLVARGAGVAHRIGGDQRIRPRQAADMAGPNAIAAAAHRSSSRYCHSRLLASAAPSASAASLAQAICG